MSNRKLQIGTNLVVSETLTGWGDQILMFCLTTGDTDKYMTSQYSAGMHQEFSESSMRYVYADLHKRFWDK